MGTSANSEDPDKMGHNGRKSNTQQRILYSLFAMSGF